MNEKLKQKPIQVSMPTSSSVFHPSRVPGSHGSAVLVLSVLFQKLNISQRQNYLSYQKTIDWVFNKSLGFSGCTLGSCFSYSESPQWNHYTFIHPHQIPTLVLISYTCSHSETEGADLGRAHRWWSGRATCVATASPGVDWLRCAC